MKPFYQAFTSFVFTIFAWLTKTPKQDVEITYIIGSNYGQSIDSNAEALVEHLLAQGEAITFIYGNEPYPDSRVLNIERGSLAAARSFIASTACFYTHSLSDVLPAGHKFGLLLNQIRPTCIFLQHGIIGLKRTLSNGVSMRSYIRSLEPTFDLMVVSSENESSIVAKMGVPQKKIANTGLARFDFYQSFPTPSEKSACIIFTWQAASTLAEKFAKLNSSNVFGMLKQRGIAYFISKHPQQVEHQLGVDFCDRSISELVSESTVLITDDSSIAWDMFLLGREALFFQASHDWLSTDPALDARKCSDADELILMLEQIFDDPDGLPKVSLSKKNDGANCARIIEMVRNI